MVAKQQHAEKHNQGLAVMQNMLPAPVQKSGFALVVVVVLLAMVSIVLTRVATTSMKQARQAIAEERDCRDRWAVVSLRRFAEQYRTQRQRVLEQSEREGNLESPAALPLPVTENYVVQVGGRQWELWIADESGKLNLRTSSQWFGLERTLEVAQDLLPKRSSLSLVAPQTPASPNMQFPASPQSWFAGYAEWLPPRTLAAHTEYLTLWGDGKLNLYSADGRTLDAAWRLHFGTPLPQEIIAARRQAARPDINELLATLSLRESQLKTARRGFSTESSCQSTWIFSAPSVTPRAYLFVKDGHGDTARYRRGFVY